ncbi:MAG TPA: trigger factor [Candidatus Woesebacteria bacterium]|nr:trigger factor [Candidatus Woesebacteria bacterium]
MKTNSADLKKQDNKIFTLNVEIKVADIKEEYQEHLKHFQADFETKGFRKGKVPLDIVEQNINPEKLFEEVASHLISHAYGEKIKEYDLKPIVQPQVKFISKDVDFDHNWQIEITSCELPEIKLNDKYLTKIKKINSDKNITDENQKIEKIIDSLVNNGKVELPEILIESDVQNQLSQLVDQSRQAGISVTDYLKNKGLTLEQYKENLKKQIIKEWTLNLAITQIAKEQKIEVSEVEVKDIAKNNPSLGQNINFIYYILTQQKVFDFLKKLL